MSATVSILYALYSFFSGSTKEFPNRGKLIRYVRVDTREVLLVFTLVFLIIKPPGIDVSAYEVRWFVTVVNCSFVQGISYHLSCSAYTEDN